MTKPKLNILINVGSYEGTLLGFQGTLQNLQSQYAFQASLGSITCAYIVSRFLLIGGYEEVVKIYDLKKKREVGLLDSHTGTITAISGYQNFVFTGSEDGQIKVWKTQDWALLQTLSSVDAKPIKDISVHSSGRLLISATKDSRIQVWNLLTMKLLYQRKYQLDIEKVRFLEHTEEGVPLILILSNKQLCLIDSETNKICNSLTFEHSLVDITIFDKLVLVSDQTGKIYFVNISRESKKVLMTFRAHTQRVKQISILKTPDLNILCTISTNGEIKLWDCLDFLSDEVEDTVELEQKVKPISMIRTNSRLICVSLKDMTETQELKQTLKEEPEKIQQIYKKIKKQPLKKQDQQQKVKQSKLVKTMNK